jgi:hypothetical protein
MRSQLLLFILSLSVSLSASAQAPLQQWIDEAIKAGGGVVTVPPGEHVLPAGLVIKGAKKLALRGMDKERCILRLAKSPDGKTPRSLIQIEAGCETIEIANLTLDGAGMAISALVNIAPEKAKPDTKDITVRDCLFEESSGDGFSVGHAGACVVERCSFRDFKGVAVHFGVEATEGVARGNHIIRCGKAFDVRDAAKCSLVGNEEH